MKSHAFSLDGNMALIIFGLAIFCVGLFRKCPITVDAKFIWEAGPMMAFLMAFIGMSFYFGGTREFLAGLDGSIKTTAKFFPTLALLMLIFGFSVPLAHRFEAQIAEALQSRLGFLWALIAGTFSPSSTAFAKVTEKLWVSRGIRPELVYFQTVTPLTSLNLFLFRKLGLGQEIATEIYKVNFVIALLLMIPFWIWSRIAG